LLARLGRFRWSQTTKEKVMADNPTRRDDIDQPESERETGMGDERTRGYATDDVRGIADDEDEDFEDIEDLDEDEDDDLGG
jgi:hypothetical protein